MDEFIPNAPIMPMLPGMEYAGFWRRFNAYGIDATIVVLLTYLVDYLLFGNAFAQSTDDLASLQQMLANAQQGQASPDLLKQTSDAVINSMFGGSIAGGNTYVTIVISAFYNIFFAASNWESTPGKRWLKCRILWADGNRLTLQQSALRHAATGISAVLWMLPCLTIFFSHEKLAPHDMLCSTRVWHHR